MQPKTKRYTTFIICLLSFTFSLQGIAQQEPYKYEQGYWTFGLNGGSSYQSSDVKTLFNGYGFGATLAKNMYYQPGAPVSFDFRGRALYTRSYGLDLTRNFNIENNSVLNGTQGLDYLNYPSNLEESRGFVFQNHQTDIGELSLEAVLTLNQLRERTGIVASIYGGIGADWYQTKIDQADEFGAEYYAGYSEINTSQSNANIRKELESLILDGTYESFADGFDNSGKLSFMPSLGLEIGYQFSPKFSMHFGHRSTFAGNNILDGQQWSDNSNDLYHYTNLGLRWIIEQERSQLYAPVIEITTPNTNPYSTRNPNGAVRATILHVNSAADITCTINGRTESFRFNDRRFATSFRLQPGRNEVLIRASNSYGQNEKIVLIYLRDEVAPPAPPAPSPSPVVRAPRIRLQSPDFSPYSTRTEYFTVRAQINNIQNKNAIQFRQNGIESAFSFNPSSGRFEAEIRLRKGENAISISARNSAGRDRAEAEVILRDAQEQRPYVEFIEPTRERTDQASARLAIRTSVERVRNKEDIQLLINGRSTRDFRFYPDRAYLTAQINLERGNNSIQVKANNNAGEASDIVYVNYSVSRQEQLPEINISTPDRPSTSTSKNTALIEARTLHVSNKSDISFTVNNRQIYDFSFNRSTGFISKTINLQNGQNEVVIEAKNQDGRALDQVNIRKIEPITVPRPPKITIQVPSNNAETTLSYTDVRASIEGVSNTSAISFYINGRKTTSFTYTNQNRTFKAKVNLEEGNNTIRIVAKNQDGNAEDQVNIRYKKIAAPTVQITDPSGSTYKTEASSYTAKATVSGVRQKSDLRVTFNGKKLINYSFSTSSNKLSVPLNLRTGNNLLEIKATNSSGSATDKVSIRRAVIEKPIVQFIQPPKAGTTVSTGKFTIQASIKNVLSKNDVNLWVNGRKTTNFRYEAAKGMLFASITLKSGSNTFKIDASNKGGRTEAKTSIVYKVDTKKPPIITIRTVSQPTANPFYPQNGSSTITADIENITDKSQITLIVNGKKTKEFDFTPKTKRFSASVLLVRGENKIEISAGNIDGTDRKSRTIDY